VTVKIKDIKIHKQTHDNLRYLIYFPKSSSTRNFYINLDIPDEIMIAVKQVTAMSYSIFYPYTLLKLSATPGPGIYSASNRNEYQKHKNNNVSGE
jgi:hypothetical protein